MTLSKIGLTPAQEIQVPARWSIRMGVVCLAALSVSLPMAWISLAKVLLFVFGLGYIFATQWTKRNDSTLQLLWTSRIILGALVLFAISLFWTEADSEAALASYVRHAKLLGILLIVRLIQTAREARTALLFYAAGQCFMLISSWLMFLGVAIPWSVESPTKYIVFSTYLDQSIMFGTVAGVFWHLRKDGLWPQWSGTLLAAMALVNALLILEGRSGYAVALATISLAVMWAMPRRLRLAALVITPTAILLGLSLGSAQVQERVSKIIDESRTFAMTRQHDIDNSAGWRLNAWHRSVQAIGEKPWIGNGVGAWTTAAKRFEGATATQIFGDGNLSNPHQEYLLWGVELGLGGLVLFVALLVGMARDALTFPTRVKYAALSVLAAMAVACLFNSTLYDDLMGDFFCVSLGLLFAYGIRSRQPLVGQSAIVPNQPPTEALA